MRHEEQYDDILKSGNLKSTKHRHAILEALEKNKVPVSAEDLYISLKEKGISISLSTVYRILEALLLKGVVTKLNLPDENKAVYEFSFNEHRHHLLCKKCRKIVPVEGCPLKEYEKLLEDKFGFTVEGHKLEVFGYCDNCRNK